MEIERDASARWRSAEIAGYDFVAPNSFANARGWDNLMVQHNRSRAATVRVCVIRSRLVPELSHISAA